MFDIDTAIANGDNLFYYDTATQRMKFKYSDDILAEYQALFQSSFPNLNIDASTPQGQIITSMAENDLATISNLENVINSFFFGGSGLFLDMWAWNVFRVTRKDGIPSQVTLTITGVPLTAIPSGFTVTDGTQNYTIVSATEIGSSGSVSALFEATEINNHVATADTINTFVTVVSGVETVTNPSSATTAVIQETDNQLFNRCSTFGATATNSSFRSILANIAQVSGVSKIAGAENFTSVDKVVKSVTLTPHSIAIVVVGGEDSDIASAIQNSRATGCDMLGNTTVSVTDNGVDYDYTFYRPTSVSFKISVVVSISVDSPTNWESLVKTNIQDYIDQVSIGGIITQPKIAQYLYRNIAGFEVEDVQFAEVSGTLGYSSYQLSLNEVAIISVADISVTQA